VSLTEKMEAKSSNFFLQKCFFKISIGANWTWDFKVLDPDPEPDPDSAKKSDPDSKNPDPQHWL
jgi:hypothetical protein